MRRRRDRRAPPVEITLATPEQEASWRAGWAEEFPGEPYPGMLDAQRRIRDKLQNRAQGPVLSQAPRRSDGA